MYEYERRADDQERAAEQLERSALAERVEELGALLADRAEGLLQKVEQRGEPLIEQTRRLMVEHPKQAMAGLAIASYIAGKLLRGRPNGKRED